MPYDDQYIDSIEKEYFHLQTQIEKFDDKSLTIKAWSVSLAAIISGTSSFTENYIAILFAAFASLMFWIIDGTWKTFQYANYQRIREIEKFMRGETQEIHQLQITTSWSNSFKQRSLLRLIKIMLWRHILFPHGIMFLFLVILYSILNTN